MSTNPHEIPNGYDEAKHRALVSTIAREGDLNLGTLRIMACHESPVGRERICIGYLANQLGDGNNIGLRLAVARNRIDANFELDGEQHLALEDTLP